MRLSPSPPAHGGQLRQISERFGIPASQLLDFSANINPQGPPATVLEAMRAALDAPAVLTTYPDLEQAELKSCIAASAGVEVSAIAVANGFVPLLEASLRTLSVRRCLLPVPAFGEYRRTLERVGVAVTPYPAALIISRSTARSQSAPVGFCGLASRIQSYRPVSNAAIKRPGS